MAEPRTKWGQIIVEKVDALGGRVEQMDRRVEQMDRRVEQMDRRVEQMDQRVEGLDQRMALHEETLRALLNEVKSLDKQSANHEETLRALLNEVKSLDRQSTNTAAVVRWTAGLAILLTPLLLSGSAWLGWHSAGVAKQVEINTLAIQTIQGEMREGFARIEAALQAQARTAERTD